MFKPVRGEEKVTAVSYYQLFENWPKMDGTHYKLIHLPAKNLAEPIRFIFAVADIPYEEEIVSFDEWATRKENMRPFKILPVLEIDNGKMKLSQHLAICRYLAKKYGLAGNEDLERAKADMYADGANDINQALVPIVSAIVMKGETMTEEKDKFVEEMFKPFLSRYQRFLKANSTNSGWFVGENLTYADLYVAELIHRVGEFYPPALEGDHDKIRQHIEKVHTIPAIAERLKNRPEWPF